eukprot:TRINITY_DN929_c0_g2_i1.p1 TRINITY_DN929_c0_g2~~TRINITY_DN929_c0_g2_i1.p1  ORF type:complete len:631 (+),score=324.91 TRINITY_DN929_c0_g2_i1:53-1894(+)
MGKKKTQEEPELVSTNGTIFFKPVEARGLKGKKLALYCKVYLDKVKKFKTAVIKTNDPNWVETPRLIPLTADLNVEKVTFAVWDAGLVNEYIGELRFGIKDLLDGIPHDDWYVLKNKKGTKDVGELRCQIMFLAQGEDPTPEHDEFPYPLHTMLRKNKIETWRKLLTLESCPDLEKADRRSQTALHVAAELNLTEPASELIAGGAKLEAIDDNDRTPLHIAAVSSLETLTLLLDKGAKVNALDEKGNTPLHIAAQKNQAQIVTVLLSKGADINATNGDGETPLHVALKAHSVDVIPLIVEKNADIFIKNRQGDSVWKTSVNVGKDHEETQKVFFKATNVVDEREFPLKQKHPKRFHVSGSNLKKDDWKANAQWTVKTAAAASWSIILNYNDPLSKTTMPMEKTGFFVVENTQTVFKEKSYILDKPPSYGGVEPITIDSAAGQSHYISAYAKPSDIIGEYTFVIYSDSDLEVKELKDWKHSISINGEWVDESAGGCIEHDSWVKNPMYSLTLPARPVDVLIVLAQEKAAVDNQAFLVKTYKTFIGFYLYEPSLQDVIDQTKKWKNARETGGHFHLDGAAQSELVVVPATHKPGEEVKYSISIFYDDDDVKFAKK